jgi:hypothetical protein
MGAKTAVLIYSNGAAADALRQATAVDEHRTVELLAHAYPGWDITTTDGNDLGDGVYPPDGVSYAATFEDADVICDRRWMDCLPSELPTHLVAASVGRKLVLHAMHSVVDALTFAVWEDGKLIRSLSLSPDSGIVENLGTPFDFEIPYWAGEYPVEPDPEWEDEEPYPLPFHPLELGEDALRALAGFILEGRPHPNDVDPYTVPLYGYRVTDFRCNPDSSITKSYGL